MLLVVWIVAALILPRTSVLLGGRAVDVLSVDEMAHQMAQLRSQLFSEHLDQPDLEDPDLLIRTGAERRVSNFMLWEIAYSELFFSDVMWPDFRKDHLVEAILDYQGRERRFGKTSAQVQDEPAPDEPEGA